LSKTASRADNLASMAALREGFSGEIGVFSVFIA
jgi:hypothetical protein